MLLWRESIQDPCPSLLSTQHAVPAPQEPWRGPPSLVKVARAFPPFTTRAARAPLSRLRGAFPLPAAPFPTFRDPRAGSRASFPLHNAAGTRRDAPLKASRGPFPRFPRRSPWGKPRSPSSGPSLRGERHSQPPRSPIPRTVGRSVDGEQPPVFGQRRSESGESGPKSSRGAFPASPRHSPWGISMPMPLKIYGHRETHTIRSSLWPVYLQRMCHIWGLGHSPWGMRKILL